MRAKIPIFQKYNKIRPIEFYMRLLATEKPPTDFFGSPAKSCVSSQTAGLNVNNPQ
jgi:hypothetical protein